MAKIKEKTPVPISECKSCGSGVSRVQSDWYINKSTNTWFYKGKDTGIDSSGPMGPKGDPPTLVVKNIQELRDLSDRDIKGLKSGEYKGVQVLGYYEEGDTPNAIIYYLSETTEPEDGGSIFEVKDIKLEHGFDDVDVVYFGAKCDYNIENPSMFTDNKTFIDNAVNYCKNKATTIKSLGTNSNLYIRKYGGDTYGYGVNGSIDFGSGYNLIMDCPLIKTDSDISSGYFIKYGDFSETSRVISRYANARIKIRNKSNVWNGLENYAGAIIYNLVRSDVYIDDVRGFEVGVKFMAHNGAYSYNNTYTMELLNNRIHMLLDSFSSLGAGTSYITSSMFYCQRIGNDSNTANLDFDRYGIVLDAQDYTPESLTFFGGVTEGIKSTNPEILKEGIPIVVRKGGYNLFDRFRHELNSTVFMRIITGTNNNAKITIAESTNTVPRTNPEYDDSILLDDQSPNKIGNTVTTQIFDNISGRNGSVVWSSGDFSQLVTAYSATGVHLKGWGSALSGGNTQLAITNGTLTNVEVTSDGYLSLPSGKGIFVDIDTTRMKNFIINLNDHKDFKARMFYFIFDSSGNVLSRDGNIWGTLGNSTTYGANGFTDFYSPYDRYPNRQIIVGDNVSKIRIIISSISNPITSTTYSKVRSMSVISLGSGYSTGNVSTYNTSERLATVQPNRFFYRNGDFVRNVNPATINSIYGWVAMADGLGNVITWKELGYFKQSSSQDNITQPDLEALDSPDATDLATAITLLNELKTKYNTQNVPLTNANKASQNTELINQRTAGQQAT